MTIQAVAGQDLWVRELDEVIGDARDSLVSRQRADGHWVFEFEADAVLMAAGRAAALDGLGLEHLDLEPSGGRLEHDGMPAHHGGRIIAAARTYGGQPKDWIDLSTSINPWAYPLPSLPDDLWRRLPEPEEVSDLEASAGAFYGAPTGTHVIASAGSQALIQLLPRLIEPTTVAIIEPTYAEHGRCWAAV